MKFSLIGISVSLLLWWVLSLGASAQIPTPYETFIISAELLGEGYWKDLLYTSSRAVLALFIALLIGIPMGLLLSWNSQLYSTLRPVLAFLRCLPAFLLITIPVLLGYPGELARILTVALASSWIITDECAESLQELPQERLTILKNIQASDFFIIRKYLFFEALSRILVPVTKTNISICFIVMIVVESFVIPDHGVGARVLTLLSVSEMSSVWAFILLTGMIGLVLNLLTNLLAKQLVFWKD